MLNVHSEQKQILIVGKDDELRDSLVETLENASGFRTTVATTFEEALSEIMLSDFDLILTEAELPDLSGMDLLAVVGGLRPKTRVIIIDDDLSAKSAVAVFRLGAVDYLYKPLNMSFLLMQVERQLEMATHDASAKSDAKSAAQSSKVTRDREKRLDPRTRPAALVLSRNQFKNINLELNRLLNHVHATFVGLVDESGNMVGAAGTLDNYDLQLLTQALNIDHSSQNSLASLLDAKKFHSTYFEGEKLGVYIVEFGADYPVALAVICETHIKPGMVWLYSKRAATIIDEILSTTPKPKQLPKI
jgi:DNA-binding response OmpR family regulator